MYKPQKKHSAIREPLKILPLLFPVLLVLQACEVVNEQVPKPAESEEPGKGSPPALPVNENLWVNGYFSAWHHNPQTEWIDYGLMTIDDIDWDAMTHLTYYSLFIGPDGRPGDSLDPSYRYNINTDRLEDIVPAAHENDTDILISIGDWSNYKELSTAISTAQNRSRLLNTISGFITEFGFDGVSLNMIPIEPEDRANYHRFISDLSKAFDSLNTNRNRRPLLTVTALADGLEVFVDIQHHIDQINLLSFEMVQPWKGWQAWHHAALHNKDEWTNTVTGRPYPTINDKIRAGVSDGILREKLGVGLSFYAYIWHTTHLGETWDSWPDENMSLFERLPYPALTDSLNVTHHSWDESAGVPYANLDNPKRFVTFENPQSIAAKVEFSQTQGLGGMMLWDIGGGFSEKTGQHELLNIVKQTAIRN